MAQSAQESRLAAIGEAAARVLRRTDYEAVRADDVAAEVRLPSTGDGRRDRLQTRSTVWFYSETRNRRVWVALGAFYQWQQFLTTNSTAELHPPASTVEARENLAQALANIALFHQSENWLMKQVARGIGDISTTEKRRSSGFPSAMRNQLDPEWSGGPWGKVARGGWNFACVAFSDYLMPIIKSSLEAVTYLSEDEIERQANLLSDLAFRVYTTNLDRVYTANLESRRLRGLPDGLAAYWFDGNLVGVAGEWVHDLEMLERCLSGPFRGASFQAEATARAALIGLFIGADTLYRRGMDEGAIMKRRYETAISGEDRFGSKEAEAFCDIASRSGLSLLRWGDYTNAVSAFTLSSDIAQSYLGADPSRLARSQVNLGEAFCELGDLPSAIRSADQALTSRTNIAEEEENLDRHSSAWRRLTIAQRTRTVIAYRSGRVVEGVQRATRLVEDRQSKLSSENFDTTDACVVLGEALLEAGHPQRAGQTIREAHEIRIMRPPVTTYGIQNDVLLLSRVELTLGNPSGTVKLLEDSPIRTDWFAERVSFRLSFEARRYYALGLAESLSRERGISELENGINALTEDRRLPPLDPLVQRYQRDLAQVLLYSGDSLQARGILTDIDEYETEGGRLCLPAHACTLLLLSRTSVRMADRPAARNYLRRLYSLENDGIDASHPTILAGHYEEAMLHLAAGDIPAARDSLERVLDNRPLGHGLPALGAGHRLLVAAQREAPKVGLQVSQEDDNRLWTEW